MWVYDDINYYTSTEYIHKLLDMGYDEYSIKEDLISKEIRRDAVWTLYEYALEKYKER